MRDVGSPPMTRRGVQTNLFKIGKSKRREHAPHQADNRAESRSFNDSQLVTADDFTRAIKLADVSGVHAATEVDLGKAKSLVSEPEEQYPLPQERWGYYDKKQKDRVRRKFIFNGAVKLRFHSRVRAVSYDQAINEANGNESEAMHYFLGYYKKETIKRSKKKKMQRTERKRSKSPPGMKPPHVVGPTALPPPLPAAGPTALPPPLPAAVSQDTESVGDDFINIDPQGLLELPPLLSQNTESVDDDFTDIGPQDLFGDDKSILSNMSGLSSILGELYVDFPEEGNPPCLRSFPRRRATPKEGEEV